MKKIIVISFVVILGTGLALLAFALKKQQKMEQSAAEIEAGIELLTRGSRVMKAKVNNPSGSVTITARPSGKHYQIGCHLRFAVDGLTEKSSVVWVEDRDAFQTDNVVKEFEKNCGMPPREYAFISNVPEARQLSVVRPKVFKALKNLAELYEGEIEKERGAK